MLMTTHPTRRTFPVLRPQVDQEFQSWLRETARRRGMSQADVAWAFPFQVHPQTVAAWFRGKSTPSYHQFVGLCSALGELPPSLRALCRHEPREGRERGAAR